MWCRILSRGNMKFFLSHLLVLCLLFSKSHGESSSSEVKDEECANSDESLSSTEDVKDRYGKVDLPEEIVPDEQVTEPQNIAAETFVSEKKLKRRSSINAETNLLKAGQWCLHAEYNGFLGPRLLMVIWFQYGNNVAYHALHSDPDECPDELYCSTDISITSETPFHIHFTFVPGVHEVREDSLTITREKCPGSAHMVVLDGSHGARLLTCNFHGNVMKSICSWRKPRDLIEEEARARGVAEWVRPSEVVTLASTTGEKNKSQTKADTYQSDPSLARQPDMKISSHTYAWRAFPGCLRVWLYAWSHAPSNVTVSVRGETFDNWVPIYERSLKPKNSAVVAWEEERLTFAAPGEFEISVQLESSSDWMGNLILDDISVKDAACSRSMPYERIIP